MLYMVPIHCFFGRNGIAGYNRFVLVFRQNCGTIIAVQSFFRLEHAFRQEMGRFTLGYVIGDNMAKIGTLDPKPHSYSGIIIPKQMLPNELARNSRNSIVYVIRKHSESSYDIGMFTESSMFILCVVAFSEFSVEINKYRTYAELKLARSKIPFGRLPNLPIDGWAIE